MSYREGAGCGTAGAPPKCQLKQEEVRKVNMIQALKALWNDEQGVTVIEYVLIGAISAIVIVVSWQILGPSVKGGLSDIASNIDNPSAAANVGAAE